MSVVDLSVSQGWGAKRVSGRSISIAPTKETKRHQAEGRKRNIPIYENTARVLLTGDLLRGVDTFRKSFNPSISRSEAVRTLMEHGLVVSERPVKL